MKALELNADDVAKNRKQLVHAFVVNRAFQASQVEWPANLNAEFRVPLPYFFGEARLNLLKTEEGRQLLNTLVELFSS